MKYMYICIHNLSQIHYFEEIPFLFFTCRKIKWHKSSQNGIWSLLLNSFMDDNACNLYRHLTLLNLSLLDFLVDLVSCFN